MPRQRDTEAASPPEPSAGPTRWGQDRRLEFIDFRLCWDGRINRSDLTGFFGISVPQASLDISRYLELAPQNLSYDRRARTYLAADSFVPLYPSSNPSRYLNEVLATASGILATEASFVGWRPPRGFVPNPGRELNAGNLGTLLRAIRERAGVTVLYQSMSRPEPLTRTLTPHAIAHDGFRWHVRAFCHTRRLFLDFVIARMHAVALAEAAGPAPSEDVEWRTLVRLVLVPNPSLGLSHRRAIELDYGMEAGQVELECRQALLFYLLRHLGLDDERPLRPEVQQVVLKNRKDVSKFLAGPPSNAAAPAQGAATPHLG
jgi:predicted DNA-binding transcriptional regulator YafY